VVKQFVLLMCLAAAFLAAQEGGQTGGGQGGGQTGGGGTTGGGGGGAIPGGGGGGIPGGGGTTTNPGGRQPFPTTDPNQNRSPFPEMQRPVFLSGKVITDDGTPPPEPVQIERLCNGGTPQIEGYTDSKGQFSIELGRNSRMFADASTGNDDGFGSGLPGSGSGNRNTIGGGPGGFGGSRQISERDLVGCEIRAALPGYRSDVVSLAGRRFLDNPNVGTIILRRLANVTGLTTSATTLLAPKEARKLYDKAHKLMQGKKYAEAQKEFERATGLYPKYAVAWYELGIAHEVQNRAEEAANCYSKSLESDSKFIKPYLSIAAMHARANKWQEAADVSGQAIKLNPYDFPAAYFYHAVASLNLRQLDDAEKSAREGLKLDTRRQMPKLTHVLGVVLAQKEDFSGAAEQMKAYLKLVPNAGDADFVRKQLAEVEGLLAQKKN
jgi:tetratricopeptide (TPR) repeat protein